MAQDKKKVCKYQTIIHSAKKTSIILETVPGYLAQCALFSI